MPLDDYKYSLLSLLKIYALCLFNRKYRRIFFLYLRILMMTVKMVMHLKKKMPNKLMIKNKMMSHSLSSVMWLTFVITYLLGRPSMFMSLHL